MKTSKLMILLILMIWATADSCITEQRCRERYPAATHTEVIKYDTTIVTHSSHFDTLFQFGGTDTVYLKDQETHIQVKVIRVKDSIYVYSECPPDTITIEKVRSETTYERVKNIVSGNFGKYVYLLILVLIIPALYFINSIIKNIKK